MARPSRPGRHGQAKWDRRGEPGEDKYRGAEMSKKLSGVIAAISTPLQEDGAPDTARAVKLARFLLDNGCNGLNVLGTTGEATSFSLDERKRVMTTYKDAG